jgi:hypothetical protein
MDDGSAEGSAGVDPKSMAVMIAIAAAVILLIIEITSHLGS